MQMQLHMKDHVRTLCGQSCMTTVFGTGTDVAGSNPAALISKMEQPKQPICNRCGEV